MRRRPFARGFGLSTRGWSPGGRGFGRLPTGCGGLQGEEEAPVPGLRGRRGAVDSFYFYDLETTGAIPDGIASCSAPGCTDAKLEPLADPEAWTVARATTWCRAGGRSHYRSLAPARCRWAGERAFFREFLGRLSTPCTCASRATTACALTTNSSALAPGGNLDPYAREWQGGNSRWDGWIWFASAYALRPEGLQWPEENGRAVFRLEARPRRTALASLAPTMRATTSGRP